MYCLQTTGWILVNFVQKSQLQILQQRKEYDKTSMAETEVVQSELDRSIIGSVSTWFTSQQKSWVIAIYSRRHD